ncbi:MAG TPA: hypothetical protein DER09_11460 [Prolixibacteraceae bacterium]|nr:hypothetical protein [Prolixibacteraceae bacterium]
MTKKGLLLIAVLFLALTGWSQNSITQGGTKGYKLKLNVGNATGATYQWSVSPANGTTTNLTGVSGDTATIVWDGPAGLYSVLVQVTDGNGCLSEPISQDMEILAPGNLIFATNFPGTVVCSDLAGGNEGSAPEHSTSSFRITYAGAVNLSSAKITIKNPAGVFVGLDGSVLANQDAPELTIANAETDKEILFDVTDSWENTTAGNIDFEILLLSAKTTDNSDITADPISDVTRTITVSPKPVIAFE